MKYQNSPNPEDYPVRYRFDGINIYNKIPNRYVYAYEKEPFPTLYSDLARKTYKAYPYTNRAYKEHVIYGSPIYYHGLIEHFNLRPEYNFYKN